MVLNLNVGQLALETHCPGDEEEGNEQRLHGGGWNEVHLGNQKVEKCELNGRDLAQLSERVSSATRVRPVYTTVLLQK